MSVDQQFNTINDKLQLLLKQHNRLKKENERLRQELEGQRQHTASAQQTIQGLQEQIALLKFASGDMNDQDKKEFEKKLNQYIREIDKCIAFLSH
jgi:cell division septum initiation protein DivIVA